MVSPLPYRQLQERANGLYDPETGRFYPYRTATGTASNTCLGSGPLPVFIKSLSISAYNSGDAPAVSGYVTAVDKDRRDVVIGLFSLPATTAASGVGAAVTVSFEPRVFAYSRGLTRWGAGPTTVIFNVVYADIIADEGEV